MNLSHTLMGSKRNWLVILYLIIQFMSSSVVHGTTSYYDPESLDVLIQNHANEALRKQRTGTLHNIYLPTNFSGIEASVLRLRSSSFWARGANFSGTFHIPPRVIPLPYVKRLAIVYQNLGNWSSYYYKVPNHTLVAPVISFAAYNSSDSRGLGTEKLNFSFMGDPILIHFPHIASQNETATLKCVTFGTGGFVEFSNLTNQSTCTTQNQGHFTIVTPSSLPLPEKEDILRKWGAIIFVAGFIGLILLGLVGLIIYKLVRRKRITEMEKESDKGVAIDTVWVGRSKMPSASMIRTQPELEHDYAP